MKSMFSKTVPRVEVSFENAGSRLHVDGQNPANAFGYNDTPNLYACSVRNVIVFHRQKKTIQIHFMWTRQEPIKSLMGSWTRIFLKTDKLISVFKNIWIHVDILKLKTAGTFPLSYMI